MVIREEGGGYRIVTRIMGVHAPDNFSMFKIIKKDLSYHYQYAWKHMNLQVILPLSKNASHSSIVWSVEK